MSIKRPEKGKIEINNTEYFVRIGQDKRSKNRILTVKITYFNCLY